MLRPPFVLITPTLKLYAVNTAIGSCGVFVDHGEIVEAGLTFGSWIGSKFTALQALAQNDSTVEIKPVPLEGLVIRKFQHTPRCRTQNCPICA